MNTSTESDNIATGLTFEPGETIFGEGDAADHFYIIAKGEVELLVGDRVVATEGEGGMFGEMALISETVRSATARAKVACKLEAIDYAGFLSLIKKSPEFALHVMRVMTDRIRNHDSMLTP